MFIEPTAGSSDADEISNHDKLIFFKVANASRN